MKCAEWTQKIIHALTLWTTIVHSYARHAARGVVADRLKRHIQTGMKKMKKSDSVKANRFLELVKDWGERSDSFGVGHDEISTTMHWSYMDRANELREVIKEVFGE